MLMCGATTTLRLTPHSLRPGTATVYRPSRSPMHAQAAGNSRHTDDEERRQGLVSERRRRWMSSNVESLAPPSL